MADSSIFKCVRADGSVLYTDKNCDQGRVATVWKESSLVQDQSLSLASNPLAIDINPLLAIMLVYAVMSVISFLAYRADKYKSVNGLWRTQEKTLHLLDVLGGWPGGFLAQRRFRHKTAKPSFQRMFKFIVMVHLVLWGDFFLGFPLLDFIVNRALA